MKKILSSVYTEHIIKGLLFTGILAIIYFVVDIRDNITYKQPYKDQEQDRKINSIKERLISMDSIHSKNINSLYQQLIFVKQDINTQLHEINENIRIIMLLSKNIKNGEKNLSIIKNDTTFVKSLVKK